MLHPHGLKKSVTTKNRTQCRWQVRVIACCSVLSWSLPSVVASASLAEQYHFPKKKIPPLSKQIGPHLKFTLFYSNNFNVLPVCSAMAVNLALHLILQSNSAVR